MIQRYRVTAGAVTVEMDVPNGPAGARARQDVRHGLLLPTSVPETEIRALLELGDIAPAYDVEDDGAAEPIGLELPEGMSVATTLQWVGSDVERAALALTVEMDTEFPRSTLVDRLEKLIAAAEAAESTEPNGGDDE